MPASDQAGRLRDQARRLILLRETGPQRAAWHRVRKAVLWELHRRIAAAEGQGEEHVV